jgi:hypothetical protein
MSATRPENVGILAMEMYTPARYVPLTELENADNCAGKYTGKVWILLQQIVTNYSLKMPSYILRRPMTTWFGNSSWSWSAKHGLL